MGPCHNLFFLRVYIMVWCSSGKFDSMRDIISESSMCTSSLCRSTLSIAIMVIHSLGSLVMAYSFHLVNLLCSIILEAPVIGSDFF